LASSSLPRYSNGLRLSLTHTCFILSQ
jgi:hypothetical protein